MTMASEKFCLRWNDFESNISTAFRELRDDKDFFDVTLSCEDEQLSAHKVILSACSPFFRNILRRNPHQHPLLYLKGVKYSDLQSVLNFMYHGEVNVAQEELNSFLAVAEELKVKGLTQNSQGGASSSQQSKRQSLPETFKPVPRPPDRDRDRERDPLVSTKRARLAPTQEPEIEEVVVQPVVKSEPREQTVQYSHSTVQQQPVTALQPAETEEHSGMVEGYQEGVEEAYEDYGDYEGAEGYDGIIDQSMDGNKDMLGLLDDQIQSMMHRNIDSGHWICSKCGKSATGKTDITRHIEAVHLEDHPGFSCTLCGEVVRTRNALRQHRRLKHLF